ncbi:MAG TPA: TrmH family RNA methyltransferase [Candidatus Paceibacterota bacterium]|nr:TrmH family RNA methyltransferase [Candidatus Paceibacterota bacterium]HRZ34216.1 TrmH family RNA methyltransferase [Candidatus Paceibacterota bacterium]
MNKTRQIILIIDNVRSVLNVGSIFRTADAIGVSKIYLVGYTPTPLDRFGRERNDMKKSALGAEKNILWESISDSDAESLIETLKRGGFKIISLEQSGKSVNYKKIPVLDKAAIVIGNEIDGVSKKFLKVSDVIAEIPMRGKKESLNVAVATAVLLFRLFDRS